MTLKNLLVVLLFATAASAANAHRPVPLPDVSDRVTPSSGVYVSTQLAGGGLLVQMLDGTTAFLTYFEPSGRFRYSGAVTLTHATPAQVAAGVPAWRGAGRLGTNFDVSLVFATLTEVAITLPGVGAVALSKVQEANAFASAIGNDLRGDWSTYLPYDAEGNSPFSGRVTFAMVDTSASGQFNNTRYRVECGDATCSSALRSAFRASAGDGIVFHLNRGATKGEIKVDGDTVGRFASDGAKLVAWLENNEAIVFFTVR